MDVDMSGVLSATLETARIADIRQASTLLFGTAIPMRRKNEMHSTFTDKFNTCFTTKEQQHDALYRFQAQQRMYGNIGRIQPKYVLKKRDGQSDGEVDVVSMSSTGTNIAPSSATGNFSASSGAAASQQQPQQQTAAASSMELPIGSRSAASSSVLASLNIAPRRPRRMLVLSPQYMPDFEQPAALSGVDVRICNFGLPPPPAPAAAAQQCSAVQTTQEPHASTSLPSVSADVSSVMPINYALRATITRLTYASFGEAVSAVLYNSDTFSGCSSSMRLPTTSIILPIPDNYTPINKAESSNTISYARIRYCVRTPFYRNVEVIVPPIRLATVMSLKSAAYKTGYFRFQHEPEKLTTTSSRTDLIIRFFVMNDVEPQLDTLPPNATVEIRSSMQFGGCGSAAATQKLYRTETVRFKKLKPKHEKPIVIPASFAFNNASIDVIITYTPGESDAEFAVGIFRAQSVSIADELAAILRAPISPVITKQSIMRELKPPVGSQNDGDDDCISAAEVSRLPLKCPISKSRITVPCRSLKCTVHHICDANSFLSMNAERPTWKCFLCNKPVYIDDLRYETYIADLIAKHGADAGGEHINLILNEKGDDLVVKKPTPTTTPNEKPHAKDGLEKAVDKSKNKKLLASSTLDNTICLSSGDEDDDDDINIIHANEAGKKQLNEKRKNRSHRTSTTTSSQASSSSKRVRVEKSAAAASLSRRRSLRSAARAGVDVIELSSDDDEAS